MSIGPILFTHVKTYHVINLTAAIKKTHARSLSVVAK